MTSMFVSIFSVVFTNTSRLVSRRTQERGTLVAVCAALLFTTTGKAQQLPQVLHHHVRPAVSSGQAIVVGTLPATQKMRLTIVLPLRNQAGLTELLAQLYDPSSPRYRHFLSVDQFTKQFSPAAEDYQAVVNFAQANGFTVTATPGNHLIVPITGTVAQVEKTFKLRMNVYQPTAVLARACAVVALIAMERGTEKLFRPAMCATGTLRLSKGSRSGEKKVRFSVGCW
jgi:hypothetical protein